MRWALMTIKGDERKTRDTITASVDQPDLWTSRIDNVIIKAQ